MAILICRVAWMPTYRSGDERAVGGGSYVDEGNVPHDALNFFPIGDTYYGFVENRGQQIRLDNLGGQPAGETVSGISVVFCAEDPESAEFLVTGWYSNATVHRRPIGRPRDAPGRHVYFTATDTTLIETSQRCFKIPRARDNPPTLFGGIGMRHIWYGLNDERAADFRELLNSYMGAPELNRTPKEAVES